MAITRDARWKIWFENTILAYQNEGYRLVYRSERAIQFSKPKSFSWAIALIGLISGIFPIFLYLLYYTYEEDFVVTLQIQDDGSIATTQGGGANTVVVYIITAIILLFGCGILWILSSIGQTIRL